MKKLGKACYLKKVIAIALIMAMVITYLPISSVIAASTNLPQLSSQKISVNVGKTQKLQITNVKKAKVKSVKWSVNTAGSKIIKLTEKKTDSVKVRGLKAGTTTITVNIKTTKRNYTKKVKVVVKKADNTVTPTEAPVEYGDANTISNYDKSKSNYALNVDASVKVHDISDMLYGCFFEDINFAADGGLYAELVQNRSFEFTKLAAGDQKHAWSNVGTVTANVVTDDTTGCLNENNPNYMVMENKSSSQAGIANTGFLEGMAVKGNAKYDFSIYAKGMDGYTGAVYVSITAGKNTLASGKIDAISSKWEKYELTLTPNATASSDVKLNVTIDVGKVAVDMVSLFPEDTYKNRKNGLRKDLAEKVADLSPAFLRFPGGCVIEGSTLDTAYNWKDSIGVDSEGNPLKFNGTYGDVAARKQGQDIWTNENTSSDQYPSFMTYGLGFYEYFLFAEDIGAVGVPVLNCGLDCMGQSNGAGPEVGTAEFKQYVQDALDLVEFCRGDASTKWGAIRIAMGHKEKFKLKYIGIGNEQWGTKFYNHYTAFVDAFNAAAKKNPEMYGDIELMYSAGVDDGDSGNDYMHSYEYAAKWLAANPDKTATDFAGVIDHHYYNDPEWFLKNADYYDEANYSRDIANMTTTKFGGGLNVFLGEYASFSNTLKSALAEAAYMTGLERNGDIVKMAAYAPLFGNMTALHWAPDLIWFDNDSSTCSVNYYVQQIFSKNAGTTLLKSNLTGAAIETNPFKGAVGIGTWNTAATFDDVKVVDNDIGKTLASDNFSKNDIDENWTKVSDGTWSVKGGKLVQSSANTNTLSYSTTGTAAYFGNTNWKNYTYTVKATKTSGSEGFLIPFSVGSKNNNYFWNIGGWGNTVSCLQQVSDGTKSGQIGGTVKNCSIKSGQTYKLKVVVSNKNVKCYMNDVLYVDYDIKDGANAESYQVVSTDDTGDIIIKMVNETGYNKTFAIDIAGSETIKSTAAVEQVAGTALTNDNVLDQTPAVTMTSSEVSGITNQFNYTVPKYSVTVLRVKNK